MSRKKRILITALVLVIVSMVQALLKQEGVLLGAIPTMLITSPFFICVGWCFKRNLPKDQEDEKESDTKIWLRVGLIALIIIVFIGIALFAAYKIYSYTQDTDTPDTSETQYTDSTPDFKYKVEYTAELLVNEGVGPDWENELRYDGEPIEDGHIITNPDKEDFYLLVWVKENDRFEEDYSEYTREEVKIDLKQLEIGKSVLEKVSVIVKEDDGTYADEWAEWLYTITVTRID